MVPSSHGVGDVLSPSRASGLRAAVAQAAPLGGNCCVSHTSLQETEGIKTSPWMEPFPSEGRIGSFHDHGYLRVGQHQDVTPWAGCRGLYPVQGALLEGISSLPGQVWGTAEHKVTIGCSRFQRGKQLPQRPL